MIIQTENVVKLFHKVFTDKYSDTRTFIIGIYQCYTFLQDKYKGKLEDKLDN